MKLLFMAFTLSVGLISCKKEGSIYNQQSQVTSDAEFATGIQLKDNAAKKTGGHYIGEYYGGGVIFWINGTKQHGLIADNIDLGQATWYNGTFTITGATGIVIGTGPANTRRTISSQGNTGSYAAFLCSESKGNGYTDWFLPSKDELNELYKQKSVVGGFANDYYWSSSEYSYSTAWEQNFNDGTQHDDSKYLNTYVRAVRAF